MLDKAQDKIANDGPRARRQEQDEQTKENITEKQNKNAGNP
jgi:hypothetical protein